MPKKKVQHKGKPKHSTTESEDFVFRKNDSKDTEEEYITVGNFEANKYKPRVFESNWSKYETSLSDFDCGDSESEVPKTNDFNHLLKTASSDCAHFEFNSEKLWKSENTSSVVNSKIFDLDLNFLSSGLACVPFYERMGLDKNELSVEVVKKFDEEAENNLKQYNSLREKSVVKSKDESNDKTTDYDKKDSEVQSDSKKERETVPDSSSKPKVEKNKEKNKLFDPDENLEDWLDSILDD